MERTRLLPNLDTGLEAPNPKITNLPHLRKVVLELEAFITDFDGVHTNNLAMIGPDGTEYVQVNRSDGLGYQLLSGIVENRLIISAEASDIITGRANKLGSDCIVGTNDKARALYEWANSKDVDLQKSIYIGNDLNDIEAMKLCGIRIAVADAVDTVLDFCPLQTKNLGGHGAVREVIDWLRAVRQSSRAETI